MSGHPKDVIKAILWLRLGLAHGAVDMTGADPLGEVVSRNSFTLGHQNLVQLGRQVFLTKSPIASALFDSEEDALLYDEEGEADVAMKLAASCGIGGAITEVRDQMEYWKKEKAEAGESK